MPLRPSIIVSNLLSLAELSGLEYNFKIPPVSLSVHIVSSGGKNTNLSSLILIHEANELKLKNNMENKKIVK